MHHFSKRKKLHQKGVDPVFVVFSDPYQELTLVRTGLIDDLRSKYQVMVIVGSALVKDHIQSHYKTSPIEVFLYEDRLPT